MNPSDPSMPAAPVTPMPAVPVADNITAAPQPSPTGDLIKIGFWKRFVAYIIDGVILGFIAFVLGFISGMVPSVMVQSTTRVFGLIIGPLYFVLMTWKQGATLGKRAMGIKVVSVDGKPLTLIQVILREVIGKFVSAIIFYIGFLMVAWDKNKQALHDKIANTYVVKA